MNWREHFAGGLIITCIAAFCIFYRGFLDFTVLNCIYFLAISFVFSLLPDIDIGTSLIRKVIMIAAGCLLIYAFLTNMNYFGIVIAIGLICLQFFHHRGMAHNLITGAVVAVCLYIYFGNFIFSIVAMLNFGTHLILDAI